VREPINSERSVDVSFDAHNGLKSDIAMSEKCHNRTSVWFGGRDDIVGCHRTADALERELTNRLDLDDGGLVRGDAVEVAHSMVSRRLVLLA
jgi:hypothetical protein